MFRELKKESMDIKQLTEKITLPVAIIVSALVLAIGFYAVQYNKQQSIERQQLLQLQENQKQEGTRAAQAQKEYIAKRKSDCLGIYKTESDKWNNVRGWRYLETRNECYIRYKFPTPKSDAQCDEEYPTSDGLDFTNFHQNSLCKEGEFENTF